MLRRAVALAFGVLVVLVIAFLAASWTLVTQQTGVDWLVRELVARSGGALEIDGMSGTLVDTLRAKRIVWRGPVATVTATDVALTWRPSMLWSRGVVVDGLGAQQLTLEFARSDSSAHALPDDLALPIDVTIERLGIAELYWRLGATEGTVKGLTFGYRGGAIEHRITDLTMTTAGGAFKGEAKLGARTPFPVAGHVAYASDVRREARADVDVAGTLRALAVEAKAEAGDREGKRARGLCTARGGSTARALDRRPRPRPRCVGSFAAGDAACRHRAREARGGGRTRRRIHGDQRAPRQPRRRSHAGARALRALRLAGGRDCV